MCTGRAHIVSYHKALKKNTYSDSAVSKGDAYVHSVTVASKTASADRISGRIMNVSVLYTLNKPNMEGSSLFPPAAPLTIYMDSFVGDPSVHENRLGRGGRGVDDISAIYTLLSRLAVHKTDARVFRGQGGDQVCGGGRVAGIDPHLGTVFTSVTRVARRTSNTLYAPAHAPRTSTQRQLDGGCLTPCRAFFIRIF